MEGLRIAIPAPSLSLRFPFIFITQPGRRGLGGSSLGTLKPCWAPCLSFPIYRRSITQHLLGCCRDCRDLCGVITIRNQVKCELLLPPHPPGTVHLPSPRVASSRCCIRSPPPYSAEDGWLLSAEASACFRSVAASLPQSGFVDHRARNRICPFEGHRLAFVVSVLVGLTV